MSSTQQELRDLFNQWATNNGYNPMNRMPTVPQKPQGRL